MKDSLVALVEAVRLARLELACFRDPGCRGSAEWTIRRLSGLLESQEVREAMATLIPDEDSPSIVPDVLADRFRSHR